MCTISALVHFLTFPPASAHNNVDTCYIHRTSFRASAFLSSYHRPSFWRWDKRQPITPLPTKQPGTFPFFTKSILPVFLIQQTFCVWARVWSREREREKERKRIELNSFVTAERKIRIFFLLEPWSNCFHTFTSFLFKKPQKRQSGTAKPIPLWHTCKFESDLWMLKMLKWSFLPCFSTNLCGIGKPRCLQFSFCPHQTAAAKLLSVQLVTKFDTITRGFCQTTTTTKRLLKIPVDLSEQARVAAFTFRFSLIHHRKWTVHIVGLKCGQGQHWEANDAVSDKQRLHRVCLFLHPDFFLFRIFF